MSKYEHLLKPLPCLWRTTSDSLCRETFTDVKLLTDHVRTQHVLPQENGGNEGITCGWSGCGQVVLCSSQNDYVAHVLFHPYHCFLKLLGSELQVIDFLVVRRESGRGLITTYLCSDYNYGSQFFCCVFNRECYSVLLHIVIGSLFGGWKCISAVGK